MTEYTHPTPKTWEARAGLVKIVIARDDNGNYWPSATYLPTGNTMAAFSSNFTLEAAKGRANRLAQEVQGITPRHNHDPTENVPAKKTPHVKPPPPPRPPADAWPKTKGKAEAPLTSWVKGHDVDTAEIGGYLLMAIFDKTRKGWLSEVWSKKSEGMVWASRTPTTRARAWGLATRQVKAQTDANYFKPKKTRT
jgi:hypothetical protein